MDKYTYSRWISILLIGLAIVFVLAVFLSITDVAKRIFPDKCYKTEEKFLNQYLSKENCNNCLHIKTNRSTYYFVNETNYLNLSRDETICINWCDVKDIGYRIRGVSKCGENKK